MDESLGVLGYQLISGLSPNAWKHLISATASFPPCLLWIESTTEYKSHRPACELLGRSPSVCEEALRPIALVCLVLLEFSIDQQRLAG